MEEIVEIYQEVQKHKKVEETIVEFFKRLDYEFYSDVDSILLINKKKSESVRIYTFKEMHHFFRKLYRKDKFKRIL